MPDSYWLGARADEHATRMYFLARMAGTLPKEAVRVSEERGQRGYISYYDPRHPVMLPDEERYWPYTLRRGPGKF